MSHPNDAFAEDIVFIFNECKRIRDMGRDVFKELPKEDALCRLPHPSGRGMMLCGRKAYNRVGKLADEAGRRADLSRRVTHQTLRRPTENILVRRFVVEGREIDKSQVDRLFSAIAKKAIKSCEDRTYFIPCVLMTAQDPNIISVGPVVFHNRANFRRKLRHLIRHCGGDETENQRRKHVRWLMANAVRFYRQFNWVADVKVIGCDKETSADVAERAVTSALDCLHLVLGPQATDRMRIGGPALRHDKRSRLSVDSNNEMHSSLSSSWSGQSNFPDGWSKGLDSPYIVHFLSLCGLALETAVNPMLKRPVSRRFLDAAQWFGEACRDSNSATRVIKYVIAIERMIVTNEKNDKRKESKIKNDNKNEETINSDDCGDRVAHLFRELVSSLCCDKVTAHDRQIWRDEARQIYTLRSNLVHGSMSPGDPDIDLGVRKAARIAQLTLLHALDELGEEALKAELVSTKQLALRYRGVVASIDRVEARTVGPAG